MDENGAVEEGTRDPRGRFVKGQRADGQGRPKGSQSKITVAVKELIEEEVTRQGPEGLRKWAEAHPSDFWKIASRLIPQAREYSGTDGGPITLQALDMPPRPTTYAEWIQQRIIGGDSVGSG